MKADTNPEPTSGASQAGQSPAFPLAAGSAPFFPSDNKETIVEVFSQAGDPAFVCGLCGCTNGDMIERIEKDIEDNRDEVLKHGDGRYLFRAHWEPAQVGDEGRIELADYWDLSLVAFLPNNTDQQRRAPGANP